MAASPNYRRKLIEVDLPLDVINRESAREKSIRHGHPSTLHLWWARRPLAACRAVLFASLVDDPSSYLDDSDAIVLERKRLHGLIERLVVWKNSNDPNLLAEARYEIARSVARSNNETAPTDPPAVLDYLNRQAQPIYDPFCGGGSIPLEAQRLGLRAVGSDLNPVAVLITKALIELPPKFANRPPVNPEADPMGITVGKGKKQEKVPWRGSAGLADDVRYYGRKMREMAWEKIGHLYPKAQLPDGSEATVIAWLWARTVPCPNPACGVAMPLMRTFQLSKKRNREHWTRPVIDQDAKTISFIIQDHNRGIPENGTVNSNGATCVACNSTVPLSYLREQARAGRMSEQMTAIVAEGDRKRLFFAPTEEHIQTALSVKPNKRSIPQQKMPATAYLVSGRGYGITHWHQLFTDRQLEMLTAFSSLFTDLRKQLRHDEASEDYSNAVCSYLALSIGKLADSHSNFATYLLPRENVRNVFARQAIPMVWDFAEGNPFSHAAGTLDLIMDKITKVVECLPVSTNSGAVYQSDASTTIYADNGPVIVTDPPYYDNISYAELSDFFYVWLRPLLRDTYPDLFASILVPIDEEMIAAPRFQNPRERFEELLNKTLRLIRERCSPEFPSSIFYAYKQQEEEREGRTSTGWETMLTALVNSGFQVVGTWPMRTEFTSRSNAMSANTLASSVVLVCRPRAADAPVASRREFMDALEAELPAALAQLTREGHIAPVDLAQAAIGPGMQIYSRYSKVETFSGQPVTVRDALAAINQAIADYDQQEAGALDSASRFCVDWLQENGHQNGSYGRAETLAIAKNVAVNELQHPHRLLTASQGQVRLLPLEDYGPQRGNIPAEMTAWEGCFRIAYHLGRESEGGRGIAGAGQVARQMGGDADSVERLARILYNYYDRKGESASAVIFNNMVTSWSEIMQQAQEPEQPEFDALLNGEQPRMI